MLLVITACGGRGGCYWNLVGRGRGHCYTSYSAAPNISVLRLRTLLWEHLGNWGSLTRHPTVGQLEGQWPGSSHRRGPWSGLGGHGQAWAQAGWWEEMQRVCQGQEGGSRGEQGRWWWAPGPTFSGWLWGHSGDQSPSQLWAKVDRLPPRTPLMCDTFHELCPSFAAR